MNLFFCFCYQIYAQTLLEIFNTSILNLIENGPKTHDLTKPKSWVEKLTKIYDVSYKQEKFFVLLSNNLTKFLINQFNITILIEDDKLQLAFGFNNNIKNISEALFVYEKNLLIENKTEEIIQLMENLIKNVKTALMVFYGFSQRIKQNFCDFMYLTDNEIISIDFILILLRYNYGEKLFLHFDKYNKYIFGNGFMINLTFNLHNHFDNRIKHHYIEMVTNYLNEIYNKKARTLSNICQYENLKEFTKWVDRSQYKFYFLDNYYPSYEINCIFRYISIYSRNFVCYNQNSLKFSFLNHNKLIDLNLKSKTIEHLFDFDVKKNLLSLEKLITSKSIIYISNNFLDNFYSIVYKKATLNYTEEQEDFIINNFNIMTVCIELLKKI